MADLKFNTDQFAKGPFRPHGHIEVWSEGNVVRLTAQGPFNIEVVQAVGHVWRHLFTQLPTHGDFADIVTVRQSMMAGPDVMQAFGQFLQANTTAGLAPKAVAWVVPDEVEGGELMMPLFRDVYHAAGRHIEFFSLATEAEQWVRAQLEAKHPSPPSDAPLSPP